VSGKPFRGFESHPLRQFERMKDEGGRMKREDQHLMISTNGRGTSFLFILHTSAMILFVAVGALDSAAAQSHAKIQRNRRAAICGNPMVACKTSVPFEPHDLPFQVPKSGVIIDTQRFYAIMLKSVAAKDDNCDVFIPEADRLMAQALFPDHKVFTSRCVEPGNLFYTDEDRADIANISDTYRIMAVYGGTTLAEAKRVLAAVKATAKFPGANLRRMSTGFNGT
jgi:hypothetical protein